MSFRLVHNLILTSLLSVGLLCDSAHAQSGDAVICIDPGHPSEVGRGTSGKHISEIQAAWQVSLKMRDDLRRQGVTVVLTKASEYQFVRNKDRAGTANSAHAELMVRLHCDGGNGIGSGFAVYYPDRQGRADGVVGPSKNVIASSGAAAKVFYKTLADDLRGELPARGLHSDTATRVGAMQGALTGSVFAKEPVVLVEMCVLTNPNDERWISGGAGQAKMAAALADAALKCIDVSRAASPG